MATLMYHTAGESHGAALLALVEGMPHGRPVASAGMTVADVVDAERREAVGGCRSSRLIESALYVKPVVAAG